MYLYVNTHKLYVSVQCLCTQQNIHELDMYNS